MGGVMTHFGHARQTAQPDSWMEDLLPYWRYRANHFQLTTRRQDLIPSLIQALTYLTFTHEACGGPVSGSCCSG